MHFFTKSVCSTVYLLFWALLCFNAVRMPGQAIRVEVDMVSLPVVVTDKNGRTDLRREDFKVLDEGVQQEIAGFAAVTEPVSVALMIDTSGSTEFQLERIQDEAILFVKSLKAEDSVAILSFADQVELLEPFSIYREKNPEAIRRVKPGGLSAVYEAVWLAIENVLEHEYGRKALVLFSDGVDNRSETVSREETLDLARRTESPIYCVYFNTDEDRYKRMPRIIDPIVEPLHELHLRSQWPPFGRPGGMGKKHPEYAAGHDYLAKLAQYSGGMLMDTKGIEDLRTAFGRVARELASQYSVGYYPNNMKRDGKFHKVEVRINRPGLTARTRQGYFAPQQ